MPFAEFDDITIHYLDEGTPTGPALVLAHALGTGVHLWDNILPLLPEGLRVVRYDARGHGQSSCPSGPYSMGALVRDAERLMDHPRLARLVDPVKMNAAFDGLSAHLKRLDRAEARRTALLSWLAVVIFNLAVLGLLVLAVLRWRGVV